MNWRFKLKENWPIKYLISLVKRIKGFIILKIDISSILKKETSRKKQLQSHENLLVWNNWFSFTWKFKLGKNYNHPFPIVNDKFIFKAKFILLNNYPLLLLFVRGLERKSKYLQLFSFYFPLRITRDLREYTCYFTTSMLTC